MEIGSDGYLDTSTGYLGKLASYLEHKFQKKFGIQTHSAVLAIEHEDGGGIEFSSSGGEVPHFVHDSPTLRMQFLIYFIAPHIW